MASDRLARQLLNMTSDPNVADPVKLAAIKDALDRSGLVAKTAVSVEVSAKPFELIFDSISSGPRDPEATPALADSSLNEIESGDPDVIVGEFDDDPLPEDESGDLSRVERESDSGDVIDVEIEAIDDGYTDAQAMTTGSGTTHPSSRSKPARRAHSRSATHVT
jgi:hypothetical protein